MHGKTQPGIDRQSGIDGFSVADDNGYGFGRDPGVCLNSTWRLPSDGCAEIFGGLT